MIARHGKLDVTTVTGTLWCFEAACCTVVVAELAEFGSVETTGDGVEEGIECGCSGNALCRQGADVLGGQEAKGHASNLAAHRLRDVHVGWWVYVFGSEWATGAPHRTLMFPGGKQELNAAAEEVRAKDRKIRV